MDPLATARYGLMAAEQRFSASAVRVAQMGSDETVDYAAEAVTQMQAKTAFTANVQVIHVADEMWQALLDLQQR